VKAFEEGRRIHIGHFEAWLVLASIHFVHRVGWVVILLL
jgi:hypothetical protein